MSELNLKPVNVLTPTVKVETKTKPRSTVVKNLAIAKQARTRSLGLL